MSENILDNNLIDNLPIAFAYRKIICDENGNPCNYEFIKINKAFTEYSHNAIDYRDVKGKLGLDVFPGIKYSTVDWLKIYADVALTGNPREIERYDDTVDKWFKLIVYSPKKEYFVTLFNDITMEKQEIKRQIEENNLQRELSNYQEKIIVQNKLQEVFLEISSEFIDMEIENFDKVINDSLNKLGEAVNADRCYIFEYYYDTKSCSNIFEWVKSGIEPFIDKLSDIPFEKLGDWPYKHKSNSSICIVDVESLSDDDPVKSFLQMQDIKSTLAVPMVNKSGCHGFIGFDFVTDIHIYSQTELNLLKEFSNILESAFQRIYLELQRHEYLKQIQELKTLFETTLMSVGDGVISTDLEGRIILMNREAEKITGWMLDEAKDKKLSDVFILEDAFTSMRKDFVINRVLKTKDTIILDKNTILVSKSGKKIPIEDSAAPIFDDDGNITGVVLIFRDFTEKKQKQEQIEFLSYHDQLTGLFNYRFFTDKIEQINRSNIHTPLTMMYIDVNGLKLTNDAFGHKMGNELLISVANVLQSVSENMAFPCRTGGDEFILIIPHVGYDRARQIKQKIINEIEMINLDSVVVSIAIGFATQNKKEESINEVLRMAEDEMYKNKLKYGKKMRELTIDNIIKKLNDDYGDEINHSSKVSQICELIAFSAEIPPVNIKELRLAGHLHDIGKIIIPAKILLKPSELTKEEFEMVKRHAEAGYQIVKAVDEYVGAATSILYHHERWDGNGYPQGIKGEEIPISARILSIADAFEAMVSDKPYKPKMSKRQAAIELEKNAGTQFDPRLVKIFLEKIEDVII